MSLLIDEPPILVSPSLARAVGFSEAALLNQIHYWVKDSKHVYEGKKWVYNTAAEWAEQVPIGGEKTIRRMMKKLQDQGLIITTSKFNKRKYDKTKWYTINYQALSKFETQAEQKASGQSVHSVTKASGQSVHMEVDTLSRPIPETTREKPLPTKKQPATSKKISPHAWFTKWWCYAFENQTGCKYAYSNKAAGIVKNMLRHLPLEDLTGRACVYLGLSAGERFPKGAPTLEGLQAMVNQLAGRCCEEIEDRFWRAGLLPEFGEDLLDFKPWERAHQSRVPEACAN